MCVTIKWSINMHESVITEKRKQEGSYSLLETADAEMQMISQARYRYFLECVATPLHW